MCEPYHLVSRLILVAILPCACVMLQACSHSLTTRNESLLRVYGVSGGLAAYHILDRHSLLTEKGSPLLKNCLICHHHTKKSHRTAKVADHFQKMCELFQTTNQGQWPAYMCLRARSETEATVHKVLGNPYFYFHQ